MFVRDDSGGVNDRCGMWWHAPAIATCDRRCRCLVTFVAAASVLWSVEESVERYPHVIGSKGEEKQAKEKG